MASLGYCLRTSLLRGTQVSTILLRQAAPCVAARGQSTQAVESQSTPTSISSPGDRDVKVEPNPQCFLCGSFGHMARACPDKPPLLSKHERPKERSQDVCERCLEKDHMAIECVNDPHPKSTLCCPLCGVNGHMKHQCPDVFKINGPGHSGLNSHRCKLCGLQGHLSEDCTHRKSIMPWQ
ncbi:DNA-binding protein HEXBP-like [Sycon ciliatum]|uniref:DNA-binding protein HEXBP-like n=1 Tax=Sycon ciliatum TaxID=27933 RepID=UPI0020ACDC84|eukprot:scpid36336/ scgid11266/ DNA-binding protein HEXBP; Hexamer-binding protein